MRSFKLLALAAILAGCSSTPTNADGGDSGGGGEGGKFDGGKTDGGGDAGPLIDISGNTDMAIHVQEFNFGMAMPQDLAGCAVRVETTQGAGGYLDGVTDAMGVAHIKVDTSKGPFDVTAALANYTAVSVINLTGPLTTPIVTGKTNTGSSSFANHTASGTITGKAPGADQVQLDAFWWSTVVSTAGNYMTTFQTATMGSSPPLPVTGIEVNAQGAVVNAVQTMMMARPNGNATIDIAFPQTPKTFTTAVVNVNWPSAGVVKGSDVTQVGDPVTDMHLGKGAIVVQHNANPGGDMFVGVGDTKLPMANVSPVTIQAGDTVFKPDYWEASYRTADYVVFISSGQLTQGAMFNVGQVNALDAMGTTLDDATWSVDTMGYDCSQFLLVSQGAMGNPYAAWTMWGVGDKLMNHKVPHLPKAVKLADITGGGSPDARIFTSKYEGGSTSCWAETNKRIAVNVGKSIGMLDPGSRP